MERNEENFTFSGLNRDRLKFLKKNSQNDHGVIIGNNKVLISCPHSVPQVRLGKFKVKETGSFCLALALQSLTNSHLIAKTKNNGDDANFDQVSDYKDEIDKIIHDNNIKYVLDFHGLAAFRTCDVNLGVNFGKNIDVCPEAFDSLVNALQKNKFIVSVDQPFAGGGNTIAGSVKTKHPKLFSMQIEINSRITNFAQNFDKMKILIKIFKEWTNGLN